MELTPITIFTHIQPDLDALASIWLLKYFVPQYHNAQIAFIPASWNGIGLGENDIAIDLEAGGKGIKGKIDSKGFIHSAFAQLAETYLSKKDYQIIKPLIRYIDINDTYGHAIGFILGELPSLDYMTLKITSLNYVFHALKEVTNNEFDLYDKIADILTGIYLQSKKYYTTLNNLEEILKNITIIQREKYKIAILDSEESHSHIIKILFSKEKINIVIYKEKKKIGIVRNNQNTPLRMDHPTIKKVIDEAGESDEWFAHPSGFLYAHGTYKAPADKESKVDINKLVEAIFEALTDNEK